jgi:pimeloyl-ACP methyl ester carboxylesterase
MSKHVWIYVPGIFTVPGNEANWTKRAVTYTHLHGGIAEDFEYFTDALGRTWGEGERAQKLAKKMRYYLYAGWELTLVGHSNGCDVILDALRELIEQPQLRNLHLISAACNEDCVVSGLADVLANAITVYTGSLDVPLQLASTAIGRGLGFGALGWLGPKNVARCASPVNVVTMPDYGHNTWFEDEPHFELTMQMIGAR